MKIHQRLLRIFPFLLVIFFILKQQLKEEKCYGMIAVFWAFILFISLLVTGLYAFYAVFQKRQNDSLKFEPYALSINLVAIVILVVGLTWGENFKSKVWVYAVDGNRGKGITNLRLTLRRNNDYNASISYADFGCTHVGKYSISGDTIILLNNIANRTENEFAEKYLLQNGELIAQKKSVDTLQKPFNLIVKSNFP